MRFAVKHLLPDGKIASLIQVAENAAELEEGLTQQGLRVLSVRPLWWELGSSLNPRLWQGRRQGEDSLIFCEQLQTLLQAGISVPESLQVLHDSERNPKQQAFLQATLQQLHAGQALSEALAQAGAGFLPRILLAMLKAAEKTGAVAAALARYQEFQTQVDDFRAKLWSAATYPLLLLFVGSLVILFLLLYVVPRFSLVYQDLQGPLPLSAKLLLAWGGFALHHMPFVLTMLLCAVIGLFVLVQHPHARAWVARQSRRIRPWGEFLREIELIRYYRSLGLLLAGGIPILTALHLSRELLSPATQQLAVPLPTQLAQGRRLSQALAEQGLVTPVAERLLQAGEKSGDLATMLAHAADFHAKRVARTTEMLSRLLGPALMAVMGLVIGSIVVLLYLPIFQLTDGLG